MKKISIIALLTIISLSINTLGIFGADSDNNISSINYSIDFENDAALIDAVKISEETYKENGRIITITKYILSDGTIMTDTFTRGDFSRLRSANGTDTVSRTRDLGTYGEVSLTAKFSWRSDGTFSYVKCDSAYADHYLTSIAVLDNWKVSRTQGEVSIGSANASVVYEISYSGVTLQHATGTVKITCSDTGSISDNA